VLSIGILGGTFNPPHLGHLALAGHAREELGLSKVLLMPAGAPPHKPSLADPGPEHRLEMCRLAAHLQDGVSVCALELERRGPSYTADTLREIHARHPEAELTFILGADTARTLPSWHQPESVLRLARLAVASRSGAERDQVEAAISAAAAAGLASVGAGGSAEPRFLSMEPIDVSSSRVRERVAAGEPVEDLLGEAVAGYIARHGLYGAERQEGA
jgi:nicotinate-nucleotide adenylyltransferase